MVETSQSRESILEEIKRNSVPENPLHFFYNMDGWLPGGYKTNFPKEALNQKLENEKTGLEMAQEFESAAKECGYSEKQIESARDQARKASKEKLSKIMTDVYVVLRLKGFSQEDLIGI